MQVSEGPDTFEFRSPHGMKAAHSRPRTFAGIAGRHLQHFNHPGRAWHDLSGPQDTLTVVLAEIGGRCEARTNLHRPAALERQRPNHISFVPAEMRVWGYTDNMESVRELRLSFDRKSPGDWFGTDLDPGKAGNPELMFHDKRAVECARLLAAECDASDPSTGLYGEGLTIALLSACFQGRPQKENSGLSVSQLRLVLDFIHEHLDLSVSVFQLAGLVDLSPSQFARMFKASTGVSPHRYQLNTRIGKAQELLLMKGESLSMVAVPTGFADQSHFARTFKRVTGATPRVASEPDSLEDASRLRRTMDFTTLVRWTWPGVNSPDARTFTDSTCDGVDRERDCADADRLRSLSKNTTAEQGGKKVVRKLHRWIRLPTNDRPEPVRS